jgi:hypothetical protein
MTENVIRSYLTKMDEYDELKAHLKRSILDMVADDIKREPKCAYRLYWLADFVAGTVRDAYKQATGKKFYPEKIEVGTCKFCNGPVEIDSWTAYKQSKPRYCSDFCLGLGHADDVILHTNHPRLQELRYMKYKEYLETPEWKEIRKRAAIKQGFMCGLCGKDISGGYNTHHKTYRNRGCERYSDLTVLCRKCHKNYHKGK